MGNIPAVLNDPEAERVCESANLLEGNMKPLWKCYRQIDKRKKHQFSIDEFMGWLGVKRSIFYDKIFNIVGLDLDTCERDGINWPKFVVFTVTYCAFGPTEILKFIFFLYDKEKNGCIERLELQDMIREIHSNEMSSTEELALEMFQNTGLENHEKVQFSELVALNKNFPRVLYPAFVLQNTLASRSMGISWWENKRAELVGRKNNRQTAGMTMCDDALMNMNKIRRLNMKKRIGRKRTNGYYFFGGMKVPQNRISRTKDTTIVSTDYNTIKQLLKRNAEKEAAKTAKSKKQAARLEEQKEGDSRQERSRNRRRRRSSMAQEGAPEFSHLAEEDGPEEGQMTVGSPTNDALGGSSSGKRRRRRRSSVTGGTDSPSKPASLTKVHPGLEDGGDAVQAISLHSPGKRDLGSSELQEV
jgi:hypothetical protein